MGANDGHRQRMKQRYLQSGLDSFDDQSVLELVLYYAIPRQDTKPLAKRLLERYGTLASVLEAPANELQSINGIGESAALLLTLITAVARRHMMQRATFGEILNSTEKCGNYLAARFFGERDEVVWLLCLDAKLMVLDCRMLFRGSVNTAGVSVRKIVEVALACNATSVVMAHNHTSGVALPSREDEHTTLRLKIALDSMNIHLSDHIIVAGDDYVSMAESGFFKDL